ncbi:MAG: DUF421 domain-containing protein [Defluviitaleaceae bacterium]|nr:DUF421 domain-containing protein [Defluviitaleaceae bacterium]
MLDRVLQTVVSSTIAIIALFILARIMGKKQMSQLNFFDYVIGITIGSIASEYAVVRSVHAAEGLTALVVVSLFSILFSYISVKSYRGRKILDGVPVVLIENGKLMEKSILKERLSINDLLEECRQKNIFDIANVEFAILETSGRLSILPKSQNRPLTPKDMKIPTAYEGLCTNVVIDGKVIEKHLSAINLDINWLYTELSNQGVTDCSAVLLAYIDTMGVLHTHIKNNLMSKASFIE